MNSINIAIKNWMLAAANFLYAKLLVLPPSGWGLVIGAIPVLFLAGLAFRKFNHPVWPRWSQVVRHGSHPLLLWPSVLLLLGVLLGVFALCSLALQLNVFHTHVWPALKPRAWTAGFGLVGGLSIGGLLYYWYVPGLQTPEAGLAGTQGEVKGGQVTYDPENYFFKKKDHVFWGLDAETGKPVYLSALQSRLNKVIPAATRSGKGVSVQMLAPQFVGQGDGVFVFDPKQDSKMPRALASFCERHNLPFQMIDLRHTAAPQLCLFDGLDAELIKMMFSAGFDLADSGQMDRVYRLEDRQAAEKLARLAVQQDALALPDMVRLATQDESIAKTKVFWGFLNELAGLPAISARSGFDLTAPFAQGGMVYIMGDPMNPIVKMAMRMVLVRVLMQIYNRPRFDDNQRWIGVILDEFKHMLSVPACDALGMIQDFKGHATLLFQSFGDFAGVPGMDEKRVRGSVLDNSKLKLVFQSQNNDTAQWASQETTTQQNYSSSSDKGHDRDRSPGQWREGEVPSIHPNMFKQLPPLTGALILEGQSRLVRVAPLKHLTKGYPTTYSGAVGAPSVHEQPVGFDLI